MASIRARAGAAVALATHNGVTRIADLSEYGGYRLKFPEPDGGCMEAVIVNTGGGVVGGDHVQFSITAASGAQASISTSSAERIYRAASAAAEINVALKADAGAMLAWLPQPTILFSGARLRRRFEADVAPTSRLVMAEVTVFGRSASGEILGLGLVHDTWRIRRAGQLIFADVTRLDGPLAEMLARPALASGARASALLVCCAPDCGDRLEAVRSALGGSSIVAGASAWNGMLVVRALAGEPDILQAALRLVLNALGLTSAPRAWHNELADTTLNRDLA